MTDGVARGLEQVRTSWPWESVFGDGAEPPVVMCIRIRIGEPFTLRRKAGACIVDFGLRVAGVRFTKTYEKEPR